MEDTIGLYAAKDLSDIVLKDNISAANGTFVSIDIKKCTDQTVLPSGQTCASENEIQ